MMKLVSLALVLSAAHAACPNKCSGHGDCTVNDICVCYQDWQSGDEAGGDCSDRTCAFDIAWADTPSGEDVAHGYAECSGKGLCNRKTGLCECFDGYTGKACRRTTCPNDCSGHGTCEYMADVDPGSYNGLHTTSSYNFGRSSTGDESNLVVHDLLGNVWDQKKTRMCVCDPKWTDVDCSRRMCPKGNDVLDRMLEGDSACDGDFSNDADQVQHVCFAARTGSTLTTTDTVALVYSDLFGSKYVTKAFPIGATASEVQAALRELPDHALESVTVSNVGVSCMLQDSTGYATAAANTLTGFAVTFTGAQVSGNQPLLDVLIDECQDGCQPKRTGLAYSTSTSGVVETTTFDVDYQVSQQVSADGNAYECGRRGKCDYSTGICECFSGFTDEDCSTQSALA